MATPRKVRLYKRLKAVLKELFEEFPDLQWFRNYHDNLVYIERTVEYIAHWSDLDGYIHTYPLTKRLNGPILYHGRDLDGRPWAFASNAMRKPRFFCFLACFGRGARSLHGGSIKYHAEQGKAFACRGV